MSPTAKITIKKSDGYITAFTVNDKTAEDIIKTLRVKPTTVPGGLPRLQT